jgi:hypothetical protein
MTPWSGRRLLGLAAAVECALAFLAAACMDRGERLPLYLGLYLAMSVVFLAVSYLALREQTPRPSDAALVLGVAAILRGFFLPVDPALSDDVFRYVWDGRVQHAGTNPYLYAPDDDRLASLREEMPEIFAGINNKEIPTLYPPLMELLFYAATSVSSNLLWMKGFFTLFDLALIFALMRLLSALGLPPLRALVYAWSPLPVVEISGNGHNDVAAVLFLVLGLWAFEKGRPASAVALAASSGLAKLGGFALIPFFARLGRFLTLLAAPLVVLLASLPYASAGALAFRGLHEYALRWRGNDSLFHVLFSLTGSLSSAKLVAGAILAALGLALLLRKTSPLRSSFWVLGAILLLSPTVHPWYLLWMAPLLAIFPHPAWLFLEASVALSYHAPYLANAGEPWREALSVKLLEYGPFFFLLGLHWALSWTRNGSFRSYAPSSAGR